uniref:START domain-containing protein n=1 Tax=Heterorhabditis bacteriophora TaxID=37862 RepID=A0A1I7WXR2_HETBA
MDRVVVPITIGDLLEELGPSWKKWIHAGYDTAAFCDISEIAPVDYTSDNIKYHHNYKVISDRKILGYITEMNKHQKRSLLNLVRDGILTDECFINISEHQSPERVQIYMPRVVDAFKNEESRFLKLQRDKSLTLRIFYAKHYSLLIVLLLYLTIYMVGFLCCCENNISNNGLNTEDLNYSPIYTHFCELNQIKRRIYLTKALQFILLWYTMILLIYAHDFNIYPPFACIFTNGFGFVLFARIAEFFQRCRPTRNGTAIAAR